jgi:hypothetical protein
MLARTGLAAPTLASARLLRSERWPSRRRKQAQAAELRNLADHTTLDTRTGAVRSVQTADLLLPSAALREIWSPAHLERLARTYWRFLARITLGLVRVRYTERGRSVVLLVPTLKLISFALPEYEMDAERGMVRWRIERGLLVARRRRAQTGGGDAERGTGESRANAAEAEQGHLQIELRRPPASAPSHAPGQLSDAGAPAHREHDESADRACLHIEIEVANFYPAIAFALGSRLYDITQSRIHVLVTRAFLRSLVRSSRRDGVPSLAKSKVGRLSAALDERARSGDSEPPAAQAS